MFKNPFSKEVIPTLSTDKEVKTPVSSSIASNLIDKVAAICEKEMKNKNHPHYQEIYVMHELCMAANLAYTAYLAAGVGSNESKQTHAKFKASTKELFDWVGTSITNF